MCSVSRIARGKQFVQAYLCRPRATLNEVGLVLLKEMVFRSCHRKSLEQCVVWCGDVRCIMCSVMCGIVLCCLCWWMYVGVSAVVFRFFHQELDSFRITGRPTNKKTIFAFF